MAPNVEPPARDPHGAGIAASMAANSRGDDPRELTPERISQLIQAEEKILDDVTAFIGEGRDAGRISAENAAELIATATRLHNSSVRLLRQLLAKQARKDWWP